MVILSLYKFSSSKAFKEVSFGLIKTSCNKRVFSQSTCELVLNVVMFPVCLQCFYYVSDCVKE